MCQRGAEIPHNENYVVLLDYTIHTSLFQGEKCNFGQGAYLHFAKTECLKKQKRKYILLKIVDLKQCNKYIFQKNGHFPAEISGKFPSTT